MGARMKTCKLFVLIFFVYGVIIVMPTISSNSKTQPYNRSRPLNKDQLILNDPCQITEEIAEMRRQRNTSHVNPARQVVEELLEIVTQNPENLCSKDNPNSSLAVVIIDTARDHFHERQLIRRTWGSVRHYRGWEVRLIFLIGQSSFCIATEEERQTNRTRAVTEEELKLQEEFMTFGDLVVGAFADTYKNLTYKHLMGYKFILESCPSADLVIKTDDDMFADIPKILDMRVKEEAGSTGVSDIYCHYYHDAPTRCKDCPPGKWFTTREEWPEDTYPPYCLGNDLVMTREWAKMIYSVRGEGGYFWVDDVFIAGKLTKIAEKKYKKKAKRKYIGGLVTDKRRSGYIEENCKKEGENLFGLFVFLERNKTEFVENVECLWKRVQLRTNVLFN